jgi:hypothetical protein
MKKLTVLFIVISLAAVACSEDVKPLKKSGTERKGDEPGDPEKPTPNFPPNP